jgi:hypothetical protein
MSNKTPKISINVDQSKHLEANDIHHSTIHFGETSNHVILNNQHQIEVNFDQLADELSRLRQAMRQHATEGTHDIATAEVAKAENAAKEQDKPKLMEHLKAAGNWALDIASKIGVPVAIEALKHALGVK